MSTRGSGVLVSRNRNGRQKARLFRQYRLTNGERDRRRCDLERILAEDNLEVCESELGECGYAACLVRDASHGGGIMIARDQDPGRRRFSLAHELGHFHIPTHHQVGFALWCADADMRARDRDAKRLEWEANDFATELLMPLRLFAADVGTREVSFRTAKLLAAPDMYDVSLTATAWRMVQTTRDACALVVSTHGQVDWVVRSEAWRFPLAERRRPVPVGSIAEAVCRGEAPGAAPEPLAPETWLADAEGGARDFNGVELFESTHAVPRVGQVLSLLWAVSEE